METTASVSYSVDERIRREKCVVIFMVHAENEAVPYCDAQDSQETRQSRESILLELLSRDPDWSSPLNGDVEKGNDAQRLPNPSRPLRVE